MDTLISPDSKWGKDRAVTRFVKSAVEFAANTVDELVDHSNVTRAFGVKFKGGVDARRNQLLECIYELRSRPVHSGPMVAPGVMTDEATTGRIRVALLAE